MKSERIPFQPIGDIDDKLEQLARDKGVSTMVKPEKGEQGPKPTKEISPVAPIETETTGSVAMPAVIAQPDSEATPRSRMKSVNMELPDYLWTDLKIRAARRQASVRHVIMNALLTAGFHIEESDMIEDGRRARGRNARQQ